MKKILAICTLAAIVVLSITGSTTTKKANTIAIIPLPVEMDVRANKADFIFGTPITIYYESGNDMLEKAANYYSTTLAQKFGDQVSITTDENQEATITLKLDNDIKSEGYELEVDSDGVDIEVADYSGAAYALQTLLQLMPAEVYTRGALKEDTKYAIGAVKISDYPRFEWRGMHLDCSRHFFSADSVKRYIDYLAMNKMNRFHWHFTDDQGWRMESKKYPLLTEKAAFRVDRSTENWDNRKPIDRAKGEEATYGGYYTQEQIKDITAYAKERGIMVIPEIEIPGHTSEVFAAYPELSCLGTPQEVTPGGYYPSDLATCFCAGNEDVFTFLENILDETIELFPDAAYIHIGGDEVDTRFWENCPKCQARMKTEGLKNTHELQSYFIKRIEKYVNSKGRPIIGWDEILEGGLAPNATVMSWQGISGGIKAAKAGHDVIMTPNSHLYFDYYQNTPEVEPKAIGGFLTTKRAYSFEPTIENVLTPEEAKHIIGVQANLWSEFIPYFSGVEYMTLPRMMAVAEIGWSPKESKDWDSFSQRLTTNAKRLSAMGANYHKGSTVVDFATSYDESTGTFNVDMISEIYGAEILFTIDGSDPTMSSTKYTKPISIDKTTDIKAVIVLNGVMLSKIPSVRTIGYHKALGKSLTYGHKPADGYRGNNEDKTLIDGFTGTARHDDGFMQGFNSKNFDVTIDMGAPTAIKSVVGSFMQSAGTWIYLPREMVVSISDDGKSFTEVGRVGHSVDPFETQIAREQFALTLDSELTTRYIRVVGVNPPTAMGLPGGGTINWIFADEIFID